MKIFILYLEQTVPAHHQNPREHSVCNISGKLAVLLGWGFFCHCCWFWFGWLVGVFFLPYLASGRCTHIYIYLKKYRITLMHLLTRPTRSLWALKTQLMVLLQHYGQMFRQSPHLGVHSSACKQSNGVCSDIWEEWHSRETPLWEALSD